MFHIYSGSYDYFMQKEIFEQPESVVNTMRGRVNFNTDKGEVYLSACLFVAVSICVSVCY